MIETLFAMGGYGGYVWPAFGLTALVLGWLLISTLTGLRARQRALAEIQAAGQDRRARRARARTSEAKT